jgi:hypothetical protein
MVSTASCTCSATCEITLALFPMALVCVPAAGVSLHNREPLDQFSNGVHGCATSNQVALIVVWASAAGTLHNGSCRYHRGSHLGNACAADCGIADVNYRTPKHFRFRRHQLPKLKDAVGAVHGSSMRAWPVLWYSAEHNTVNNQQKAECCKFLLAAHEINHAYATLQPMHGQTKAPQQNGRTHLLMLAHAA